MNERFTYDIRSTGYYQIIVEKSSCSRRLTPTKLIEILNNKEEEIDLLKEQLKECRKANQHYKKQALENRK